jgi:GNAT superfamily N-acetyltransferase
MMRNHVHEARKAWLDEFLKRQTQGLQDDDLVVWSCGILSEATYLSGPTPYGSVLGCEGEVQGVVIFEIALQPSCRTPGSLALYVNYLAPAPWNRSNQQGRGRFQCVGRRLVAQAIRESLTLGCPGRIGLHSYPSAIEFYKRIGFEQIDSENSRHGMTYFEMGPKAALALLSESALHPGLVARNC